MNRTLERERVGHPINTDGLYHGVTRGGLSVEPHPLSGVMRTNNVWLRALD